MYGYQVDRVKVPFQPAPPMRGATRRLNPVDEPPPVSTRAPHAGSDRYIL